VSIGERKAEPALRHVILQLRPSFDCSKPALLFLPVVLAVHPLNLAFPCTLLTGIHGGFATCCVERELVAWNFAFTAADALTPPVGVSRFGASLR
jgi:hypothetical protein